MRTTLIQNDGQRIVVEPSHASGFVHVWKSGDGLESIDIPVELAGAFAQAVTAAAATVQEAAALSAAAGA